MNTECDTSNSWAPFLGIAATILNIAISLGKQYLNNGKHMTADTLKEIIKGELQGGAAAHGDAAVHSEAAALTEAIELNIPENLKASITAETKKDT